MCENEKKNLQELDDSELDRVSGGASDEIYLDEVNLPAGWFVTCCQCKMAFPAGEGCCPVCGGVEVLPGIQSDIVYDSKYWKK